MRKGLFFSKNERKGIVVLGVLLVLLFLLYSSLPHFFPTAQAPNKKAQAISIVLRTFNPNTIDSAECVSLGIRPYLAQRIMNYRKAGGMFRKPEDLSKIYGLDDSLYQTLKPYIHIPQANKQAPVPKLPKARKPRPPQHVHRTPFDPNTVDSMGMIQQGMPHWMVRNVLKYRKAGGHFKTPNDFRKIYGLNDSLFTLLQPHLFITPITDTLPATSPVPAADPISIEINQADSIEWLQIKGIGPTLSHRILVYRDRLGGFYKKEQLHEVYGIDSSNIDSLMVQVRVQANLIRPIEINKAPLSLLMRHPYLTFKQAELIVRKRSKAPITSWQMLRDLQIVIRKDERLLPYLDFGHRKSARIGANTSNNTPDSTHNTP